MDEKPLVDSPLATATSIATDVAATTVPASLERFRSCRWRKTPEDGVVECCAHRDVLPLTGAKGFDAEAWCPDCGFYKLRRTPKKREDFGFAY